MCVRIIWTLFPGNSVISRFFSNLGQLIVIKWGHRACFRPISHFYRQRKLTCRLTSGWKPWSSWSKCSKNCDGGKQTRTRACSVKECDGRTRQTRSCNTYECDGRLFLSYTTQKQEPTNLPNRPFMWLNIKQENILASGLIL